MTVITLQQENRRGRRAIDRDFCPDEVHLAQMASGAERCEHCAKPLFKSSLPKCEHSVYRPAANPRTCSLCSCVGAHYPLAPQKTVDWKKEATPQTQKIVKRANGTYSRVRINSSDTVVPHTKHKVDAAKEVAMLSQIYGYEGEGFFFGVLRGAKLVKVRDKAPRWVKNAAMLRELASTQQDSERAASVLYLFHVCGQTDADIADHLKSSEDAITKYRQRLEKAGKARFASGRTKAA